MRTILCYGDSNTHGTPPLERQGVFAERYGRDVRWPGVMAAALGAGWHLVEEGLNGRTTVHDDAIEGVHRNGATVLPAVLESHKPIDVMVLMLGTNDCKQRFGLTSLDIALGVRRLMDMAQASGLVERLLVVSPAPITETGCLAEIFRGGAERSAGIAAHLYAICEERGAAFLDAGAHVTTDPLDGVHLSPESHRVLGEAVAARVRALVSEG